jgi:cob(I)alamin adenosyltransferase
VSSRRRDEPVRLTRIYTRGGDGGETSLGNGARVSKLDPLVRAYGEVDELNSLLGWVRVVAVDPRLGRIQNELFDLGADLSVPFEANDGKLRIEQGAIDRLEADCDEGNIGLPELKSFVLPGGSEAAARLHVARAVCRRAERSVLEASTERPVNPLAAVYLNRLSDLLFVLARAANAGSAEPLWLPGGERAT